MLIPEAQAGHHSFFGDPQPPILLAEGSLPWNILWKSFYSRLLIFCQVLSSQLPPPGDQLPKRAVTQGQLGGWRRTANKGGQGEQIEQGRNDQAAHNDDGHRTNHL